MTLLNPEIPRWLPTFVSYPMACDQLDWLSGIHSSSMIGSHHVVIGAPRNEMRVVIVIVESSKLIDKWESGFPFSREWHTLRLWSFDTSVYQSIIFESWFFVLSTQRSLIFNRTQLYYYFIVQSLFWIIFT